MSYANEYHDAVTALKKAFQWALENDEEENLQGELWRHYQGMKAIAKSKNLVESFNVDPGVFGAAQPVDWNVYGDGAYLAGGAGSDVITFGS